MREIERKIHVKAHSFDDTSIQHSLQDCELNLTPVFLTENSYATKEPKGVSPMLCRSSIPMPGSSFRVQCSDLAASLQSLSCSE